MFNFSNHTKSFIALLLIAFTSVMTAYYLTQQLDYEENYKYGLAPKENQVRETVTEAVDEREQLQDIVWKDYTDKRTGISFKYPEKWKIRTFKENKPDGWYVIALDPGKGSDFVRIYVGKQSYYDFGDLPVTQTKVAGENATNLEDSVVTVQHDGEYYTFYLGSNVKYKPEFKEMVKQVAFSN